KLTIRMMRTSPNRLTLLGTLRPAKRLPHRLNVGRRTDRNNRERPEWPLLQEPVQVADRDAIERFQLFFDRDVRMTVHPVESQGGQAPHRPFAAKHRASEYLVLGLAQLVLVKSVGDGRPVKLSDPPEIRLGLVGLAREKREESTSLVVVLIRKLRSVS